MSHRGLYILTMRYTPGSSDDAVSAIQRCAHDACMGEKERGELMNTGPMKFWCGCGRRDCGECYPFVPEAVEDEERRAVTEYWLNEWEKELAAEREIFLETQGELECREVTL